MSKTTDDNRVQQPPWRPASRDNVIIEHDEQRVTGCVTDVKANGQWALVRLGRVLSLAGHRRHVLELVRDDENPDTWVELVTTMKIIMRQAR